MHNYRKAVVSLIHSSPIDIMEIASHMPKMNHHISPNTFVQTLGNDRKEETLDIDKSLLNKLINIFHHNSVSEHSMLSFVILGMSRGALGEFVRSRIGIGYTVTSTRHEISPILYHFIIAYHKFTTTQLSTDYFISSCIQLGTFVIDEEFNASQLYDALVNLYHKDINLFMNSCYSVGARDIVLNHDSYNVTKMMEQLLLCKTKIMGGDYVKHLVTDSWATNMSVTFNLRSYTSFMKLRDSDEAWYQIRDIAKAIKEATPLDYLKLAKME